MAGKNYLPVGINTILGIAFLALTDQFAAIVGPGFTSIVFFALGSLVLGGGMAAKLQNTKSPGDVVDATGELSGGSASYLVAADVAAKVASQGATIDLTPPVAAPCGFMIGFGINFARSSVNFFVDKANREAHVIGATLSAIQFNSVLFGLALFAAEVKNPLMLVGALASFGQAALAAYREAYKPADTTPLLTVAVDDPGTGYQAVPTK